MSGGRHLDHREDATDQVETGPRHGASITGVHGTRLSELRVIDYQHTWTAHYAQVTRSVYAQPEGLYVVTSTFFVEEEGLFLPRSAAFTAEAGTDPEYVRIVEGLYAYTIRG